MRRLLHRTAAAEVGAGAQPMTEATTAQTLHTLRIAACSLTVHATGVSRGGGTGGAGGRTVCALVSAQSAAVAGQPSTQSLASILQLTATQTRWRRGRCRQWLG